MMLKLTYTKARDRFSTVTVMGDSRGIRDLYWQLTKNYLAHDGTAIGSVRVTNLDGVDCTATILFNPFGDATQLSGNLD